MAQHELETADDCRQRLQEVAEVLEHLHDARRLRMSTDACNTAWIDIDAAIRSVLASLDVAVQTTAWMESLPAGSPGTRELCATVEDLARLAFRSAGACPLPSGVWPSAAPR